MTETTKEIWGFSSQQAKDQVITTLRAFRMGSSYYIYEGKNYAPTDKVIEDYYGFVAKRELFTQLVSRGLFGNDVLACFIDTVFSFLEIEDSDRETPALSPCIADLAELIPVSSEHSQKYIIDTLWKITLMAFNFWLICLYEFQCGGAMIAQKKIQDAMNVYGQYRDEKNPQPFHKVRAQAIEILRSAPFMTEEKSFFPDFPSDGNVSVHYAVALESAKAISPEKYEEVKKKLFDFVFKAFQKLGTKWTPKFENPKKPKMKASK